MTDPIEELRSAHTEVLMDSDSLSRARRRLMEAIQHGGVPDALESTNDDDTDVRHGDSRTHRSNGTSDIEWSHDVVTALPARDSRPMVAAAVFVLIAAVVGLLFVVSSHSEHRPLDTATESPIEARSGAEASIVEIPDSPIRGFEAPVIVFDSATSDVRDCIGRRELGFGAAGTTVLMLGVSPIAESHFFDSVDGAADPTVFVNLGWVAIECDAQGPVSYGTGDLPALAGPQHGLPSVVVFSGGSVSRGDMPQFRYEGIADESVESVVLVTETVGEQVFQRSGERFRIEGVASARLPTDDEDLQIEITYVDGSSELRELFGDRSGDCIANPECLGSWFVSFIDSAREAGSTEQVAALSDFALTQVEYDSAVGRFQDCLPSDMASSLDPDSPAVDILRACYEAHIEFVENARLVHNAAWLATEEGQAQLVAAMNATSEVLQQEPWTEDYAERIVLGYLAALAAGQWEIAAASMQNSGTVPYGSLENESPAAFLERACSPDLCRGPYEVVADGPGSVEPFSLEASSTVTVSHPLSGEVATMVISQVDGQPVVGVLPPLVPGEYQPLVERLFGEDLPNDVVVGRFDAVERWASGTSSWTAQGLVDRFDTIDGDVALVVEEGANSITNIDTSESNVVGPCAHLLGRGVVRTGCTPEVFGPNGEMVPFDVDLPTEPEAGFVSYLERSGVQLIGTGDAEGNLTSLTNGTVDLLADDYASLARLSPDGTLVAYVDHADERAASHFWSPVVVVKETASGSEIERVAFDGPISWLEFDGQWIVIGQRPPTDFGGLEPQVAISSYSLSGRTVTSVETPTRIWLP